MDCLSPQEMRALSRKETDGLLFLSNSDEGKNNYLWHLPYLVPIPHHFINHRTVEALTLKEITYFSSFGLRVQSYEVTCQWVQNSWKSTNENRSLHVKATVLHRNLQFADFCTLVRWTHLPLSFTSEEVTDGQWLTNLLGLRMYKDAIESTCFSWYFQLS